MILYVSMLIIQLIYFF